MWQPTAALALLRRRAALLAEIRTFFAEREVLEVETPTLSAAAVTSPHIESFITQLADGRQLYLHTSPEFPMKRLLAAGIGDCYQLCKVFRQGERGRNHNPEFTLLEWYRLGFDHFALMNEVAELLQRLLPESPSAERLSYREVFQRHLDLDPLNAPLDALRQRVLELPVAPPDSIAEEDRDTCLDWLMSQGVAPKFAKDRPTLIYHYPASQAALARLSSADPNVAERFECYWGELELANGFHELLDAAEQQSRFEAELAQRSELGMVQPPLDSHLIDALAAGMPACAGVALGIDRLLMVMEGVEHIEQVIAFPLERA